MGTSEPTAGPRSKLDFIYQEVLGDVADLVKRLEAVQTKMQELERSRAGERSAEALEQAVAAATSRARGDFERAAEQARRRLLAALDEAVSAARPAEKSRWWLYATCTGLALGASAAAGTIIVLAHLGGLW